MANIRINTIGSGCDYSTINDWWMSEGPFRKTLISTTLESGNLVALDLIKIGELAPNQTHLINASDSTYWLYNGFLSASDAAYASGCVDPYHFFILRAKPGYEFKGNYTDTTVPVIQDNYLDGTVPILDSLAPYSRFDGFIVRGNSTYDGYTWDAARYQPGIPVPVAFPQNVLDTSYRVGRVGGIARNNCIFDSIGFQHIWNSGSIQNGYFRAVGIISMDGSVVRNCTVSDVILSANTNINVFNYPAQNYAIGIAYSNQSIIYNNTVGNITANRYGYDHYGYANNPETLVASNYFCPYSPIYNSYSSSTSPNLANPECSGGLSLCNYGTTSNGATYSDGGTYNASCYVRVIMTIATGAQPCGGCNDIYNSTYILPFINTSGYWYLDVTKDECTDAEWIAASGPPAPTRTNGYVKYTGTSLEIKTSEGSICTLPHNNPSPSTPFDCRNIDQTFTWTPPPFTVGPCLINSVSARIQSIQPTIVSGSTVITSTTGVFNSYLYNNIGYNASEYRASVGTLAYSGGVYNDILQNFYPSGHLVGGHNASADRSSGYVTGVIPTTTFVNQYTNQRLLSTAWQVINSGTSLNTSFLWDIEGQIRGTQWDIGADEYGSGIDSNIPEYIPLMTYGSQVRNTGLNLYIGGVYPSALLPLWIGTYASPAGFDNSPLISGRYPQYTFPLYTIGTLPGSGGLYTSLNLNVAQGILGTANTTQFPLYVYGYDKNPSGTIPLWIGTHYEETDLLQPIYPTLRPGATGTPNSLSLFIEGSYTGGHNVVGNIPLLLGGISGIKNTSLPLVLPNIIPRTTINTFGNPGLSGFPLFVLGANPATPITTGTVASNHPGVVPLFIYGAYATKNGAIPLYVVCSGTSSSINLYTKSGGNNPDPYFVGTDGAQGKYTTMPLFINRPSNNDARWLSLYMQTLAGKPSGVLPLELTGANGPNASLNMYINSTIINNILKLFESGW